jgi:putative oxidoreductase
MNLLRLSISPLPAPAGWYAFPLRLIIGFGFMQHGYAKLARGPEDFIGVLHAMGLPVPFTLGWATIITELVGGLMILAGALIPLSTVPMAIVLLVAIFTVHLPNGFSSIKLQSFDAAGAHFGQPGYETDLLYLAGLVALCLGGPGPLSIDGLLTAGVLSENKARTAQINKCFKLIRKLLGRIQRVSWDQGKPSAVATTAVQGTASGRIPRHGGDRRQCGRTKFDLRL